MLYKHVRSRKGAYLYGADGPEKVLQLKISCGWGEALYGHGTAFALCSSLALSGGHRATSTHLTTPFTSAPARHNNLHQRQVWERSPIWGLKKKKDTRKGSIDGENTVTFRCLNRHVLILHSTVWRGAILFLSTKENLKTQCVFLSHLSENAKLSHD